MAVNYNTNKLVENIKRRAGVPANDSLYSNQDILNFINEAMYGEIVPIILSQREDYLIDWELYTITAGQRAYPIPSAAVGGKVRSVELVSASDSDAFSILDQIMIEQIGNSAYMSDSYGGVNGTGFFYFEANNIILYPTPSRTRSDVKLRIKYFRRPNELVPATEGAVITAVDTITNTLTMNAVPTGFNDGDAVDVVAGRPPFNIVASGVVIQSSTATSLTFNADEVDNVSQGDTVALQGFSITPNISMPEAHNLLVQAGVVRLLEGVDDGNGLQTALALYERQKDSFRELITPRADSSSKKIVPTNDFISNSRSWRYYR